MILLLRTVVFVGLASMLYCSPSLQLFIGRFWELLKSLTIFNSVYFETGYVVVFYTILVLIPATIDRIPALDRFKLDPKSMFQHPSYSMIVKESIIYMLPLATLDTFMVKWYAGVPESEILPKKSDWIQVWRALPTPAPSVREIAIHLLFSFLIYDLLFFLVHLTLHKNAWLYKNVHAVHHQHQEGLQSRVTNQLSVTERVVLVLSANFSLKVLGAHPLTRVIYVPIFLWLLIENHWNYDFPFSVDKIAPFDLMGGSKKHFEHHERGRRYYQPFFNYLDLALEHFQTVRSSKMG